MPEEKRKIPDNISMESDTVTLGPDDCAIVIRKHGNVDFTYNIGNPEGSVPVAMVLANGILLQLQEQEAISQLIDSGLAYLESQISDESNVES